MAKYVVKDGVSFVGSGRVYGPGDEIDETLFNDAKKVAALVSAGKLVKAASVKKSDTAKLAKAQKAYDNALEAQKAAESAFNAAQTDDDKIALRQKLTDANNALNIANTLLTEAKVSAM